MEINYEINDLQKAELETLCRKYHIVRLSLFGSFLKGDNTSSSDLDLLVDFEEGFTPGFAFAGIQYALSEIFGRQVDLHTPASLSRYFRSQVIMEARSLYETSKS